MSSPPHEAIQQHSCSDEAFASFDDGELESSLSARFEAQVDRHRSCLAVRDGRASVTYGELDRLANGVAHAILDRVGDDSKPVALVFAQGVESTAAILGTLKSGHAYVSLDPSDPRGANVVEAVGARVVLTDDAHREQARHLAGPRELVPVSGLDADRPPCVETSPDHIAYVFFTSGSTGEPKGVFDSHRNVLHNVLRYTNSLRIAPSDRLTLLQAPAFSGAVSSLFGALLNGAAVFPFRLDERSVSDLAAWLRDERITIYHSVPSIFRSAMREAGGLSDLRIVRLEGDRASWHDVELHRRHTSNGSMLVNGLGTTETGLARQFFVGHETDTGEGVLPIGYGVRDVEIAIVDDGREVAAGVAGEIAVSSEYLALGYWNRPDLTSRAFVDAGGSRTYLTGDLGRMRADGCIEYLGRRDGELKVLGHRVEPAEVEAAIALVDGVREAAVTTREGRRGEGQLIAYVVAEPGSAPTREDVHDTLSQRLPSYMIPTAVVVIDALPLGANGKVDRRALPELEPGASDRAPADGLEQLVARIWADVFELESVGAADDFFALGGDSLAAAEIVAEVERQTGVVLPAEVLVSAPTVTLFTEALATQDGDELVVLNATGSASPLVLCRGLHDGNTFIYRHLARRVADRPVWELAPRFDATDPLADIVDRQLDALRAARPTGPYLLGGYCSAGIVAFELACRLRAAGEEVPLLAIFGISPIDFPDLVTPDVQRRWSRRTLRHLRYARSLPLRRRPGYLAGRVRAALTMMRRRIGSRPKFASPAQEPYEGRVALVLDEWTIRTYSDDPAEDWAGLSSEKVDVLVLPGGEEDLLTEPLVADLASYLDTFLSELP